MIQQLESREYKRMWRDTERNVDQAEFRNALPATWLRLYLLDQLETTFESSARSARDLTGALASKPAIKAIADYLGSAPAPLFKSLLQADAVPFLDACVYTESGREKRASWQQTWEAQRAEDCGEPASPSIPSGYSQGSRGKSKDFASDVYWRLRGKLDVPKERFISYPGCESDEDHEPVYGWAGWNHRQRAVALATLYTQRKREEGWKKDRLQPMLAGILELLPWLKQWHNEPDAEFDGAIPAVQFAQFLDAECAEHGFTFEDLRNWRPQSRSVLRGATKKLVAGEVTGRIIRASTDTPSADVDNADAASESTGAAAVASKGKARARKPVAPKMPASESPTSESSAEPKAPRKPRSKKATAEL